uniref:Uncharacterized protein n=1 Tax=viral metagenome TaxID=1070528 RepID=A0A6C0EC55_9ZZZZ
MSDKTLTKAIDNNLMYNNHYYKIMNPKLKIL